MRPNTLVRRLASASSEWGATLNLPSTRFPMRANAAAREPLIAQRAWEGLYRKQRDRHEGAATYVVADGPPFANGPPHMGHALNKVLKDIIARYRMLQGHAVDFTPGWDCHGLPIELLARKKAAPAAGASAREAAVAVRVAAERFALKAIDTQGAAFRRWGVLADWENPYLTMHPEYEAAQLEVFVRMHKAGLVHRGLKPVHWSPSSRTALAEAELEYAEHESTAVYAAFDLIPGPELASVLAAAGAQRAAAVAWTTTPWTLPSNRALAVGPELRYALVRLGDRHVVVAEPLVMATGEAAGTAAIVEATFSASALLHSSYLAPCGDGSALPFISAAHVTAEDGTGIVHTAPAHGMEDFQACQAHGIPMGPVLVDGAGRFTADAGPALAGLQVLGEGNRAALAQLEAAGAVVAAGPHLHRYPHDWRTRKPVIMRATEQWFVELGDVRVRAAEALTDVEMVPATGRQRLASMLERRSEWCISRQRAWGVPIPVFYDAESGEALLSDASFEHVIKLVREQGVGCWWSLEDDELLAPAHRDDGRRYVRGTDTMDVWFDSGTSWAGALAIRLGRGAVADVYLEGSDQHRGWFQSSLLTAIAASGEAAAPFRTIVTHGFVVAADGRKMSKSLGNGVNPSEVIEGGADRQKAPAYGADVLRVWAASSDSAGDVNLSAETLAAAAEHVRRARNCGRFLLGNLDGFCPEEHALPLERMLPIDRFMLHRIGELSAELRVAFESFRFQGAINGLAEFINMYLNKFYFEIVKDRLYLDLPSATTRRSAQTAMEATLRLLIAALAPVAPHLADELHGFHSGINPTAERFDSCVLTGWPKVPEEWHDPARAARWETVRSVRRAANRAVEEARQTGAVSTAADAVITIEAPDVVTAALCRLHEAPLPHAKPGMVGDFGTTGLEDVLMCSQLRLGRASGAVVVKDTCVVQQDEDGVRVVSEAALTIGVAPTPSHKCPRCWRFNAERADELCPRCHDVVGRLGTGVSCND